MKNIILVETSFSGHRITYLIKYIYALQNLKYSISIVSPNSEPIENLINLQLNDMNFIKYQISKKKHYKIKRLNSPLNAIKNWKYVSKIIKTNKDRYGLVFFMGFDDFLISFDKIKYFKINFSKILNPLIPLLMNLIFPYKWAGLNLRPELNKNKIFESKYNFGVGILNEFYEFSSKKIEAKKILFPDIANLEHSKMQTNLETDILEKAKGRKIISILGSIDKRKSVFTLLDTAQLTQNNNYFFLIAGESRFDSYNQMEIDRLQMINKIGPDNCFTYYYTLTDGIEFNALINISDIVFASYLDFPFSSNLLTKTAYFKKPVIVSNQGCMAYRVIKYKLGITIQQGLISQVISAIHYLLTEFKINNTDFDKYYSLHTDKALDKALKKLTF